MTENTNNNIKSFEIIHKEYQLSLEKSKNILEIVNNFRQILKEEQFINQIPDNELISYHAFIRYVEDCYFERAETFLLTNLLTDVSNVIMYIIIYYNDNAKLKKQPCADCNLNGRRKSLRRDLGKSLKRAFSDDISGIKDRFGARLILLNNDLKEEECNKLLIELSSLIISILTRTDTADFLKWINENPNIDEFTKIRLEHTLSLPFKIDRYKDLVSNPKEDNNYQSIHATIALPVYSPVCPGAMLDLQFRTFPMHQNAEFGKASHTSYEEENKLYDDVFNVENFGNLNIVGFSKELDIDGITSSKTILNRRISQDLV